jgi:branched-chain amino acid transport system substrate-binding protein
MVMIGSSLSRAVSHARIALALVVAGCSSVEAPDSTGAIVIGLQGPMTGEYAAEGTGYRNAVTMLVDQTNAAGGINGRQVQLVIEDDKGDAQESALVADRLVAKKVIAVIGAWNSGATEPASATYNRAGILHVTPASTATRLTTKGYQNFFRVCFLDDRQGFFAATFITQQLALKKVALVHDNSGFALGLAESTKRYLEAQGANITFYDAINPAESDFGATLTKLKATNPEVVYFTGYFPQGALLLKQAAAMGLKMQWIGGNGMSTTELITAAGVGVAKGVIVTTEPLPSDLDSPEAKQFVADYKAKYGAAPNSVWTMMAADAFRVVRHAMTQTTSTDSKVLAEWLRKSLKNYPAITGPIVGFDDKGDRLGTFHRAYVVDDRGQFVPYTK